jgi:uncharacterized protein (TIGR03435 family)
MGTPISGNRVTFRCASLRNLILQAWDIRAYQLAGGPAWLTEMPAQTYDVIATVPGDAVPTMEQVRPMLRTLLEERFQLKVHRETREIPIYGLVVGKSGPKLQESAADAKNSLSVLVGGIKGEMKAGKESMARLAVFLSTEAGRPVIDQTGLSGEYDVKLQWTRDQPQLIPGTSSAAGVADPGDAPSLFTAVQEQLGLKLEPKKGPVETIVVDHAEKPTEN